MTPKQLSYSIIQTIIFLVLGCLLLYFFYEIRLVFSYLAIAAIIALMGRPLVGFLKRRLKVPHWIGAIFTLILFYGIITGFVSLFISLVLNQPIQINNINSLDDLRDTIKNQLELLSSSLSNLNISFVSDYVDDWFDNFQLEYVSGFFGNSLSFLSGLLMDVFSISFISFFFLRDKDLFNNMLLSIVPDNHEPKFVAVLETVKDLLSRYFIGLFLQALVMFTLYLIILLSFGIDNAPIIAIICALFNLIPYLGPVIGGILIVLLSLSDLFAQNNFELSSSLYTNIIWILILYLLAQLWDNFINQPLIYSKSVKSNPLEIFIVILIGGILFGVIGVIVAIPAYTVIRVFLKEFFSGFKIVKSITKNL